MGKRIITSLMLLSSVAMQAQSLFDFFMTPPDLMSGSATRELKFEYDVDFQYHFDNREFTVSDNTYDCSGTFNAAVLTPSAGISVNQGGRIHHRIMAGIDLWRNMGECPVAGGINGEDDPALVNWDLFREMTLYYDVHAAFSGGGRFEAVAGVFPRSYSEGEYGQAFYSDATRFWDRNLDGVLLKYAKGTFYAEAGCDWMGMKGVSRKERFEVYTAGRWAMLDGLYLGWAGSFYHYAGSELAPGVVDNHLVNPYLKMDLGQTAGVQELSMKLGGLITYQRDRLISKDACINGGGQLDLAFRNWNLGLYNLTYIGKSLAPYYTFCDSGGNLYGDALYRGNPMYRASFYDRVECFWMPKISDFLSLKLAAVFHFTDKDLSPKVYQGCQQQMSLIFNLDALRNPRCRAGVLGSPSRKQTRKFGPDSSILPL